MNSLFYLFGEPITYENGENGKFEKNPYLQISIKFTKIIRKEIYKDIYESIILASLFLEVFYLNFNLAYYFQKKNHNYLPIHLLFLFSQKIYNYSAYIFLLKYKLNK